MIGARSLERWCAPMDAAGRCHHGGPWLAVVTCMDPRVEPQRALEVQPADAYVLRNAGGRVTDDVLRSLVFGWSARGVQEITVIHHADCGLLHGDEDALRRGVEAALDVDASGLQFAAFDDLDGSVTADVEAVRTSGVIPDDLPVTGFVLDETTGRVRAVATHLRSQLRGARR